MRSNKKFIKNSHNLYLLVPKVAYNQFHRTNRSIIKHTTNIRSQYLAKPIIECTMASNKQH
jgi:hypothetical protein